LRVKLRSGKAMKSAQTGGVWSDKRGVSAIEFALLAPVVILMYVGTVEIGNLITVERRVETVASTAADLTAQVKQVSNADLTDIVAAASNILAPYNTAPLKVVLSSVVADQNNNGKVAWSYASSGSGRAVGTSYGLPPGTTEPNSSVIVAEATYAYTPVLDLKKFFSPGALNLQRTFYTRPRRSLTVAKN
jgi:Flp pilus assembly protein TadG